MKKLKVTAKMNKEMINELSNDLGIPEEKIPFLAEKLVNNPKSRDIIINSLGKFFGRRNFLEAIFAGGVAAVGLSGLASAKTEITDSNVKISDAVTGLDWHLKSLLPFSAIVGIEGNYVRTYDGRGNLIASGTIGVEDAGIIQITLDSLTTNRSWKEKVIVIGSYTIPTTIRIPSYTILDLSNAKLKLADNANDDMFKNSDQSNGNTEIEIVGGILDGNIVNQVSGIALINMGRVTKCKFRNIEIVNSYGMGMAVAGTYGSNYNIIENNIVRWDSYASQSGRDGIYTAGKENIVKNNIVINAGDTGIVVSGREDLNVTTIKCIVESNLIEGSGHGIILYRNSYDCKIHNNIIKSTNLNGIYVYGVVGYVPHKSEIINNKILSAGQHGIQVTVDSGTESIDIKDNKVYSATNIGIYISYSLTHSEISGNKVFDCGEHGIQIVNPLGIDGYLTVANNEVRNNGTSSANTYDGIQLYRITYSSIVGNICIDTQATPTQRYGINESTSSDYNTIVANVTKGNATAGINITGLNTINANNIT